MPKSRFVSAGRLKPLIGYFAVAFVVVLAVGALVPSGETRSWLIVGWLVLFPVGGWLVWRRGSP